MNDVKRYHVGDTGLVEGVALGRITVVLVADFERVTAERDALQLRLTTADQRVDDLETQLDGAQDQLGAAWDALHAAGITSPGTLSVAEGIALLLQTKVKATVDPAAEACQFPQSCTARCDCDIPDFSPGNGNKARRRAETIHGLKIVEDQSLAPGEMKLVQPAKASAFSDANEPPCTACFARGCNGECSGDGAMGD
ncbi:hypothetical protein [Pseudomonas mandelii]|uniref:Uncharacterized protein n=1 Tax=Pseudomonas mandelii TaxID=75612 RepID=A0AB36CQQ3_9PSED|nr:hypothetical protein [Pseudomonas mandelii]NMZ78444.1 hypothetical protein [Pseudomonas mandelii]